MLLSSYSIRKKYQLSALNLIWDFSCPAGVVDVDSIDLMLLIYPLYDVISTCLKCVSLNTWVYRVSFSLFITFFFSAELGDEFIYECQLFLILLFLFFVGFIRNMVWLSFRRYKINMVEGYIENKIKFHRSLLYIVPTYR